MKKLEEIFILRVILLQGVSTRMKDIHSTALLTSNHQMMEILISGVVTGRATSNDSFLMSPSTPFARSRVNMDDMDYYFSPF